jgi:threonine/homoserine/homoserine lactone efflux protein
MITLTTLVLFSVAVVTLLLSPGPNMAFVLSHGVACGRRGGLAAAGGIALADVLLTLLTATGVTAVVAAWPPSFDVLRYAGAAYLLWLAFKALRADGAMVLNQATLPTSRKVFSMAMLNCLLNPKALLFFMVFLPQFVNPQAGSISMQIMLLGVWLTFIAFVFHVLLGAFAGQIGQLLQRHPRAAVAQRWVLASVLGALALRLLFIERPAQA